MDKPSKKMNKIVAFQVCDNNFKEILDVTYPVNRDYFKKYNIDFVLHNESSDSIIPESITGEKRGYWKKMFILDSLFDINSDADWFLFIDADAVFLRSDFDLRLFIDLSEIHKEFIVCETNQGYSDKFWNVNTGVFFWKNTPYMRSILHEILKVCRDTNASLEKSVFGSCEQPVVQNFLYHNYMGFSDKASIFPSHSFNHDGSFIYHACNFSTLDMNPKDAIMNKAKLLKSILQK